MIESSTLTTLSPWQIVQQEFQCEHQTIPTKAKKANGVICVYLQCQKCGEKTQEAPKRLYNIDDLPWFDVGLREDSNGRKNTRYQELWENRREEIRQDQEQKLRILQQQREEQSLEYQRHREEQDRLWWEKYNQYLASPHWTNLRKNVINRDNCRCQNCFIPVTEESAHVHHTSYVGFNRLGYSYAFECVTLCRKCHVEFHPKAMDGRKS